LAGAKPVRREQCGHMLAGSPEADNCAKKELKRAVDKGVDRSSLEPAAATSLTRTQLSRRARSASGATRARPLARSWSGVPPGLPAARVSSLAVDSVCACRCLAGGHSWFRPAHAQL
jgi:hypothetical protein